MHMLKPGLYIVKHGEKRPEKYQRRMLEGWLDARHGVFSNYKTIFLITINQNFACQKNIKPQPADSASESTCCPSRQRQKKRKPKAKPKVPLREASFVTTEYLRPRFAAPLADPCVHRRRAAEAHHLPVNFLAVQSQNQ